MVKSSVRAALIASGAIKPDANAPVKDHGNAAALAARRRGVHVVLPVVAVGKRGGL